MTATAITQTFPFPGSSYLGPDPEWGRLRSERPVAPVLLADGRELWLVSRHADVRAGLSDPRFSRAEVFHRGVAPFAGLSLVPPEMIISTDAPEHTRLRTLVMKVFTGRRIDALRPGIEALVEQLIDDLERGGRPADLVADFATPLPLTVICDLLGVPPEDRGTFHTWARMFAAVGGPPEQIQQGIGQLMGYIAGLIASKRAEPGDDVLSALIAARDDDDRLSEQELVVFGFTLLGAGFDSSASQIANSVLALVGHHRDQWDLLVEHPELAGSATDELLRSVNLFGTDTTGFPRVTTAEVELGGATIPEGALVMFGLTSANHDPAVFADADRIDLTRTPNRHLAFGHGIHRCLGAQLARTELEVALSALTRRLPGLRLAVPEDQLRWQVGDVNHTLLSLPVTW